MQTKEAERNQSHEEWLEVQKRKLYEHKVEDLAPSDNQSLSPPVGSKNRTSKDENTKTTRLLDSVDLKQNDVATIQTNASGLENNVMIYFDAVLKCSRDVKEAELCYCIQRDGQVLAHPKPCIVKMKHAQQEMENPLLTRINFNYAHHLEDIGSPANLIVEMRKYDPMVENSLKSVAWTILQLYDPAGQLSVGKWRLPMYKIPTKLGIDISRVAAELHHSDMELVVRITQVDDTTARKFQPERAIISHYNLAHFHKVY